MPTEPQTPATPDTRPEPRKRAAATTAGIALAAAAVAVASAAPVVAGMSLNHNETLLRH